MKNIVSSTNFSVLGVLFFTFFCCISCKETVREELQILIQNRTDSSIHITLYPQKTASTTSNLYPVCEGCGGHKSTNLDLYPNNDNLYNWNEVLFYTNDLNIKPHTLASKVFDSIYISSINKDDVIIKFTHKNVTGYSENIFTENSAWDFRVVERDMPDQSKKHPVRSYCYIFVVLEDKIVIENILNK